ncbi:hypothetical protein FRB97_001486 [Tulasnella sp. 331]|nr:hypothetical protein FRB97_001486 [Tulasnella sp. 331]
MDSSPHAYSLVLRRLVFFRVRLPPPPRLSLGALTEQLMHLAPGVNFYLTMWYRRQEQALRMAIFFSAATAAGAFGGLLSAAIANMDGIAGLHGWSWIFLLEGLLTVCISIGSYFVMHDYPATAKFLTKTERAHVVRRLNKDNSGLANHMDRRFFWQAFFDYKVYLLVVVYLGLLIPLYAFSLFLPTIIKGLGYSSTRAQLLSVPPYIGGCIMTILGGWYSDKYRMRGPFIIGFASIAIIGYAILLGTKSSGAGYAGAFIAALEVYPTIPVLVSWAGSNVGGDLKRGVAMALVIGIGNLGGVCSSFIYIADQSPRYPTGHGTVIGVLVMAIVFSAILMIDYKRINKRKMAKCIREGIKEGNTSDFSI